jgi:hypothetical protein
MLCVIMPSVVMLIVVAPHCLLVTKGVLPRGLVFAGEHFNILNHLVFIGERAGHTQTTCANFN